MNHSKGQSRFRNVLTLFHHDYLRALHLLLRITVLVFFKTHITDIVELKTRCKPTNQLVQWWIKNNWLFWISNRGSFVPSITCQRFVELGSEQTKKTVLIFYLSGVLGNHQKLDPKQGNDLRSTTLPKHKRDDELPQEVTWDPVPTYVIDVRIAVVHAAIAALKDESKLVRNDFQVDEREQRAEEDLPYQEEVWRQEGPYRKQPRRKEDTKTVLYPT